MKLALFALFVGIILLAGCTYHNEEEYYVEVCDTMNVTYSGSIQPILQFNCLGCHYNNNIESGIELEDYEDVKARVDDGSLLGSITHAPGYEPMPQLADKLDDCAINQVRMWIENGAPNN